MLAQTIINSPLFSDPFQHLYVRNFLSNELYTDLLSNLPLPHEFPINQIGVYDKKSGEQRYEKRRGFPLHCVEEFFPNNPRLRNICSELLLLFNNQTFIFQLFQKFTDTKKFTEHFSELTLQTRALICYDDPGYSLKAHTDIKSKVFTIIVYLGTENSQDEGTLLLSPKKTNFLSTGEQRHNLNLFEIAKVIPGSPNSALLFFRTPLSWHSKPSVVSTDRFTLQVNINLDPRKMDMQEVQRYWNLYYGKPTVD